LASSIRDDRLIANPQKFLPLADVSLESHALGNPTGRDQAALDLLASFRRDRNLTGNSGSIEVSRQLVMLAGLKLLRADCPAFC